MRSGSFKFGLDTKTANFRALVDLYCKIERDQCEWSGSDDSFPDLALQWELRDFIVQARDPKVLGDLYEWGGADEGDELIMRGIRHLVERDTASLHDVYDITKYMELTFDPECLVGLFEGDHSNFNGADICHWIDENVAADKPRIRSQLQMCECVNEVVNRLHDHFTFGKQAGSQK